MASVTAVVAASPGIRLRLRLHLQRPPRPLPASFPHAVNPNRPAALRRWLRILERPRATSASPPSPSPSPSPDPPPSGDEHGGDLQVALSKIQDRVRIFFAVLFWMSLFFWGSAWDGRDTARKNKGRRLKK